MTEPTPFSDVLLGPRGWGGSDWRETDGSTGWTLLPHLPPLTSWEDFANWEDLARGKAMFRFDKKPLRGVSALLY
jgi:hypothetical protein